ncbi:1-aminocyclopropane-1-carboxylate deaminase/D-cysteine desulfhydrase [uncultured Hymenobacter sp.]|uniref:1-aminocyclopropane-1-carboxylate deaminase/D-cysteine desulfhydrase n=1 Tax=uncultured Hymenobacter sp. TaxID=170016 RepID=UPI0035CC7BB3
MILQPLETAEAARRNIRLLLLRDDLAHPELPGNKWRKLKYNLAEAQQQGYDTLLTFGGAFSNHIAAVATAGRLQNLRTIGVIRGEETAQLNPTLARAAADGMHLRYLDRSTYRRKQESTFLAELLRETGPAYVIPEGGSNALALPGCAELVTELTAEVDFDYLCVACGTGGTLAGLLTRLDQRQAVGISALKGGEFLRPAIDELTQTATGRTYHNYELRTEYHFGGYAHFSAELLRFIEDFEARHGVLLDPIYTGKLLCGVLDLLRLGYFKAGSTVVVVHTGGLQGWAGFKQRFESRSSWWPNGI